MTILRIANRLKPDLADIRNCLAAAGVETRPVFVPIPLLPPYGGDASAFPMASLAAETGFCLPAGPMITDEEVNFVSRKVNEVFGRSEINKVRGE